MGIKVMDYTHNTRFVFRDPGRVPIMTIGASSYVDDAEIKTENHTRAHVLIGRFCSISNGVTFIVGANRPQNSVTTYPLRLGPQNKIFRDPNKVDKHDPSLDANHFQIFIGNDVFIGEGAKIMGGVKIHNGAIIGAGSVVTKDVPPYAVVAGNPAKVIRYRFDKDTIKKLQLIRWWNINPQILQENAALLENVPEFIKKFYNDKLGQYAEDDIGKKLEEYRKNKWQVYSYITDFNAPYPLWRRVLKGYLASFKRSDKVVMSLFLVSSANQDHVDQVKKLIDESGDKNNLPTIIMAKSAGTISAFALRQSTHLILNREDIGTSAYDVMHDRDVKLISALDEKIFPNEPHGEFPIAKTVSMNEIHWDA